LHPAVRLRVSARQSRLAERSPGDDVSAERFGVTMVKGLHHNAYRCRDSEETRKFYEDFLGLPLCQALAIEETKSGRTTDALHTFYRLDDGSYLAFFEVPDEPFEFKEQHDYDLHIALEVGRQDLDRMLAKGRNAGMEPRGITDHAFIDSIYFRDPNGYVIELTAKRSHHDQAMDPAINGAQQKLKDWQAAKPR
jgi:catechol 2,3-dioxygenase-like lactoylglutathione lyase family enzyme